MIDIDALLPGLTFELPETDTVLPSSSPLKDICLLGTGSMWANLRAGH